MPPMGLGKSGGNGSVKNESLLTLHERMLSEPMNAAGRRAAWAAPHGGMHLAKRIVQKKRPRDAPHLDVQRV